MMLGQTFPLQERVAADVAYTDMMKEFGWAGCLIVCVFASYAINEVALVFGAGFLPADYSLLAASIYALVPTLWFAFHFRAFGRPMFIFLLLAAAPAVARLYGAPVLAPVLEVLALNIFLAAFAVVPACQLAAKFRFRALGLMALGSTVAGGVVACPLAVAGHGVAALLGQRVAGVVFYSAAACAVARWTPPAWPGRPVLEKSFRFSWPLMQAAVVDYVSLTGYVMVVGLRMSAADVGLFRIAQRLVEVLQEVAYAPARKVLLPVFVAVRDEPERQVAAVASLLDALAVLICLASAVCGAAARPIVLLMFGRHWAAAAPVFQVLTITAPVAAMYGIINPLLTASGRTRMVSVFALGNVVSILAAAWFAAPFGLTALAWALAARGVLTMALFVPAMRMGLGRRGRPLLRLLLLPAGAMFLARVAAGWALAALPGLGLGAQFFVATASASGVFFAVLMVLAPARMTAMAARLGAVLGRNVQEERRFI